jgi:hypothetical protein
MLRRNFLQLQTLAAVVVAAGLSLAGARTAPADEAFRCGRWIVSSELTPTEVLEKCGEPASRKVTTEDVYARSANGVGTVKIGVATTQVWRYDRGNNAAAMLVTIVDDKVRSIEREKK